MNATDYLEKGFLNVLRGTTLTAPGSIYLGLYLSSPGESGTEGAETDYDGYARQAITFSAPAAMSGGIGIQSLGQLNFPAARTAAGTIQYVGLCDSPSGGNVLAYGPLAEPIVIRVGEAPVLLAGEVQLYLLNDLSASYKTKFLNVFRGESIAGVSPCLALWNGDPENKGAELTGDNYARVALTFAAPAAAESGQTVLVTSTDAAFNRPTTEWGNWTHTTVQDASSGGEPIYISAEAAPAAVKKGYMPIFAAGDVRLAVN